MSQILAGRRALAFGVSALVIATGSAPALAQGADQTVVAYGQASVKPTPKNAKSSASIAAAVRAAGLKALPLAIADAKQQATDLAAAAGVTLGDLLSVSNEPPQSPFYGPFFSEQGTFGPGKYCGDITTVRRVKGKDGKTHLQRRRRHTCRVPPQVVRQVELTYAIVP